MQFERKYKCSYCNNYTNLTRDDEVVYDLVIPNDIIPKEAVELLFANYYKYGHHKFCNWKCYNNKVVDDIVNYLNNSLLLPEQHFLPLNIDRDIAKTRNTITKLKDFKEDVIKN